MLVLCYDIKCLLGSEETLGFSRGRGEASPALAAALQASRSPDLTALHPPTLHACPPAHAHTKMTANTQACRHTPAITHLHTQTHVHAHGHTGVCLHTLLCAHSHTPLRPRAHEAPPLPIYPTNPSPPSAPAHPRAPFLSILPSPGTNPRARVLWVTALNHCVRITSGGRIRREGEIAMKRSEFWVRSWNRKTILNGGLQIESVVQQLVLQPR